MSKNAQKSPKADAPKLAVVATESTQKGAPAPAPAHSAAAAAGAADSAKAEVVELTGISKPDKPVRSEDIWQWVRKHAGNNPVNVEVHPLENVALDSKTPVPFVKLDKPGKRSAIIWAALNGVGKDHDRRLSAFLQEGLRNGMSKTQCADLVALLNGGYSRASKSWGTSFVKLVVKPAAH